MPGREDNCFEPIVLHFDTRDPSSMKRIQKTSTANGSFWFVFLGWTLSVPAIHATSSHVTQPEDMYAKVTNPTDSKLTAHIRANQLHPQRNSGLWSSDITSRVIRICALARLRYWWTEKDLMFITCHNTHLVRWLRAIMWWSTLTFKKVEIDATYWKGFHQVSWSRCWWETDRFTTVREFRELCFHLQALAVLPEVNQRENRHRIMKMWKVKSSHCSRKWGKF